MIHAGGQPATDNVGLEYDSQGKLRLKDDGVTTDKILNSAVNYNKLDTTESEQSTAVNANVAVTGGQYCFYPQSKANTAENQSRKIWVENVGNIGTAYATYVGMTVTSYTAYTKFRYVTASGVDYWLFLLIDKATKEILCASSAPDHVSFGNGDDPAKLYQPFAIFDPALHEIVLVDFNDTLAILSNAKAQKKSVLELVNDTLKVNTSKTVSYRPLHTGHFNADKSPVILTSLNSDIKVRNIKEMTVGEKNAKAQKELDKFNAYVAKKEALNLKLKNLGLTDEEIVILKRG